MGQIVKLETSTKSRFVISAEDLNARIGHKNLRIVDASFYLPAMKRDAAEEFQDAHIPGAVRFDIDTICADNADGLAHMLADAETFTREVGNLGISETNMIVIYDGIGLFSAPRVWFNFRQMGAENVLILDGGFRAWQSAGFDTEKGAVKPKPATFTAKPQTLAIDIDGMRAALADPDITVADARPYARFTAEDPEPREGMKSGHMPGAKSVPLNELIENGRLKPLEDLRNIFEQRGIFENDPVVTTCGSGVTAAAITLALESLDHKGPLKLYDGSWSEWGARDDTDVATGEEKHGQIVHVTRLEMTRPPRPVSRPSGLNISLLTTKNMQPSFYRFLQREVGELYTWVNRRRMSDEALHGILTNEDIEISVLYLDGSPAGFFEINRSDNSCPEIDFFGLMPRAVGMGLGKWFLYCAVESAWSKMEPPKIRVQTCSADHPAALPLYQKLGFEPVTTWDEPLFPLKPFEQPI